MTDDTTDVHGPIDFLLLQFTDENLTGEAAAALLDLVDAGIIRIYDLLVVHKDADGTFSGVDMTDLAEGELGGFTVFAGARSGLLGDEDLAAAADLLEPGTMAAMLVYENSWAIPFVTAARKVGAQVIARERIPADVLMDVLDELDAADAAR